MKSIKPLGDRVIVKVIEPTEKTPGGVILLNPGNQQEVSEGVITDIGPGRTGETISGVVNIPIALSIGNKVLFAKSVGIPVVVNDEKYKVIHETDVIAVYED